MTDPMPDLARRLQEGDRRPEVLELVKNLKAALPDLEKTLEELNGHWWYEDRMYRFYHQSFKVFSLQDSVLELVKKLEALAPKTDRKRWRFYEGVKDGWVLHPWFMEVVEDGTKEEFDTSMNKEWTKHARPVVEAFLHAKYFLEMAVKYGREFKDLEFPPNWLPSGWAAFLYLYDLR